MDALTLTELSGLAGCAVYMGAFATLQLKLIDGNSTLYSCINIAAATLVLISLTEHFNMASAIIQVAWIMFGTIGIYLKVRSNRTKTQSTPAVLPSWRDQMLASRRSEYAS